MRVSDGTKRRLTREAAIDLPPKTTGQRAIVFGCHLHEEIVWVLPVVDRRAITHFAGGQQIRIAAPGDRQGFEARHAPESEAAARDIAPRHSHHPVDAAGLLFSTVATLVEELSERVAVPHPCQGPNRW